MLDKRASNRENAPRLLKSRNVEFEVKNNGIHLIVTTRYGLTDFWPGTGKFVTRRGYTGRGIFNLLKLC